MRTQYHPVGQIEDSAGQIQLHMWQVTSFRGHRPLIQHSHPQFEISTVLQGGGIYQISGKNVPMETGDVFVFSGNETHCIVCVEEQGLELLNLHFEPQYMWSHGSDAAEGFPMDFWFHHSKQFSNRISSEEGKALSAQLLMIREELLSRKSKYKLMVRNYLQSMLVGLIRQHRYTEDTENYRLSQTEGIQRVITYLDANIGQDFSLKELAAIANMSPNYFSAHFHRECRVTLWDYIGARRVDKAARLLLDKRESQTMLDIALACGFHNTANFNKTFRKYMGVTPSQYRKQAKDYLY